MKKYILGFILICVIAAIGFLAVPKLMHIGYGTDVGQIMHVVAADMKHEHTISWKTAKFGEPGNLEIRPKQSENIIKVNAEAVELPAYNGGKHFGIYTAHITNLTAGTEYEYRISVGKRQSAWMEFKTEPESTSFKALIFGDSQSLDYKDWAKTAQTAWEKNGDAAFFVNMGDLVDNGQDEWQWNAWFNGGAKLFAAIPVVPVMGNHETYSLDWKMAKPDYYLSLFALPANGLAGLERFAYSYDYGDVHFIVLNTQLNELQEWYPDLLEQQQRWLAKDLSKTQKKWKVVLMHRGIWTHPFNGPLDVIGQTFVPVFDQYHVDLVFTGHVHSYARTKALKNGNPDPDGTIYISTGRSGDRVWDKSPQKPMDELYYNPLDMPNYLVFEASHDALKVTAFKQNGEIIDQTELKK
ncbi:MULTISPECIES: purple acid phosphatase family protein [Pelosinus]|uniref:Metallophosphoesterase n=1 Tax=Pelosinus fermentans B4 TaxID=1149862 RepID=I9B344_9FIRM|nr:MULTISPECIES: metallophosphoesterase family protein [Pelosinus]EIW19562.1 metallophosphoesterase [Pelosinus fermentans B4]EIW24705.1 metallophosphoesterase [Pelosinus fermentans A11]OAM96015.1 metallophosphoesterase [Pelosinus fermentans DSM 17108]SDR35387.1 Purple acid Phosphatase, N-terminal domain [Pelosinus fermentans]